MIFIFLTNTSIMNWLILSYVTTKYSLRFITVHHYSAKTLANKLLFLVPYFSIIVVTAVKGTGKHAIFGT